jgi:two-component system response regulator YesN
MVCIASRALRELDERLDDIVMSQTTILETIYNTENIFDLNKNILCFFSRISSYFSNKHNQKNLKVINRIKEIINKKYHENLSTSRLSEEIYLTPNYLSQIFKQATGETITEYITKTRMEQAKELLKSTSFKIIEIAEMVGYDNPHYFSTAFKKYTGIHPQKFRSCSNT